MDALQLMIQAFERFKDDLDRTTKPASGCLSHLQHELAALTPDNNQPLVYVRELMIASALRRMRGEYD
jgi:hypothetical protein